MKDKSSIISTAQKYASKGQLDKAIAEWQKLLDKSNDGNIHNTIGDLYLKKGSEQQAIECFTTSAEIFKKDGFYPKAIAVYKKVLNLMPNNVDAIISLAKLNAERGLIGNAVENYFRAAEIFNRDGLAEKATLVIEKILQLSPADIGTRMKIADMYIRIGHRERAANEYASVGSAYLDRDETEKAREMFVKASEFDKENIQVLIGLGKIAERENNIDGAFEQLERALRLDPKNKDVLLSHANLAIKANRTTEAADDLLKLIGADPSDIRPKKTLCELYINQGVPDKAWDAMLPHIDKAVEEKKWEEANELLNIFDSLYPVPVKQRRINIYRGREDPEGLKKALKELAELHEDEDANDEAVKIYKEVLELDPENTELADKIRELEFPQGGAPAEPDESPAEENLIMDNSMRIEAPADESLMADNSAQAETPADNHQISDSVPQEKEHMDENIPADTLMQSDELIQETTASEASGGTSHEDFIERKAEADFFAQQGLNEEALKIYKELIAASPDNAEIKQRIEAIESASTDGEEIVVESEQQEEAAPQASVDDDLQAIFEQFENKPEETETIDYEAHYSSGLEYKQKGLLDEAIKELQIAAKDPEKKIRNSTMLALCYQAKGSYPPAISEFTKIVESMTPSDSTYLHVKYELASAYLNNKDESRALEIFSEIQAQDSNFKDVSDKVDSLRAQEQGDKPKPKKDRVSYI